jgi:hypothetical protein
MEATPVPAVHRSNKTLEPTPRRNTPFSAAVGLAILVLIR